MSCNCKKNINKKYVEDGLDFSDSHKVTGFSKVVNIIAQFLFGLLVSSFIIVGSIPMFIYVIVCVCTGKDMTFRIPNFTKWFKKK